MLAKVVVSALCLLTSLAAAEKSRNELLKEADLLARESCLRIAPLYDLEDGVDLKEITEKVLFSSETTENVKRLIAASGRRFFLFNYPSDGLLIKGVISWVPNPSGKNLLVFLRGGNRLFGVMNPATLYSCMRDYTVIATAYRGGVSEGTDEFGGSDVNDVEHLMDYLPVLESRLNLHFSPKNVFMLGGSRGGMEMFLALGRSRTLQHRIDKAASLSGVLDMRYHIVDREDMRQMFINDFGLVPGVNEEEWINLRNPILTAAKMRKNLPLLILQGTDDLRVSLQEGYHMIEKLKANGNPVTYIEVPGGNHCLKNQLNTIDLIADWFESESLQ
jgi:dipeptidyl aminopeptidase/acylaminoacyl peptidase